MLWKRMVVQLTVSAETNKSYTLWRLKRLQIKKSRIEVVRWLAEELYTGLDTALF